MAIKMVKCSMCQESLISNGVNALRNEIQRHFIEVHPAKLEEWNKFNQDILVKIIKEKQKLIEKALELVDEPSILVS